MGLGHVGDELEVEREEAVADEAVGFEAGFDDVGVDLEAVGERDGFGACLEERGVEERFEGEFGGVCGVVEMNVVEK